MFVSEVCAKSVKSANVSKDFCPRLWVSISSYINGSYRKIRLPRFFIRFLFIIFFLKTTSTQWCGLYIEKH